MTDIVERLRSPEVFIMQEPMISRVAYEAADEIERLRNDEKKYQAIISKLIGKKVANEYWSKVLDGEDFNPWDALKEEE